MSRVREKGQRRNVDFFDEMLKIIGQFDDFWLFLNNFCNFGVFLSPKSKISESDYLERVKLKKKKKNLLFSKIQQPISNIIYKILIVQIL